MMDGESGNEGCGLHQFERNNYFYGKLMTVRDFQDEQVYVNGKRHLVNRHVHGWGIVCGFREIKVDKGPAGEVVVTFADGGVALDCCGREIVVPAGSQKRVLDKKGTALTVEGMAGHTYCLYLKYRECYRERVEAASSASGCDPVCCWNRILEDYEVLGLDSAELTPVQGTTTGRTQGSEGLQIKEKSLRSLVVANPPKQLLSDITDADERIISRLVNAAVEDLEKDDVDRQLAWAMKAGPEDFTRYAENLDIKVSTKRKQMATDYVRKVAANQENESPCTQSPPGDCLKQYLSTVKNHMRGCQGNSTSNSPKCCVYLGFIPESAQKGMAQIQFNECGPDLVATARVGDGFQSDDDHRRYVYSNPLLAELICRQQQPQEQTTICKGGVCSLKFIDPNDTFSYICKGIELGQGNTELGWSVQLGIGLQWPSDENDRIKSIKYPPELAHWGLNLFGTIYFEGNLWKLDIQLSIDKDEEKKKSARELHSKLLRNNHTQMDVHWWAVTTTQKENSCICEPQRSTVN